MATKVAHRQETVLAHTVIQHLHGLVIYGPGDLEIASAMSAYGYDAVKWAEGQGMLAELVTYDEPLASSLAAASVWCREATRAAQQALCARPQLLAKLGIAEAGP
jgi:hypothetical protein